jgi:hypothetical protein
MLTTTGETGRLISEAHHTYVSAKAAAEALEATRAEISQTLEYFRWLRFFDYDVRAMKFLEKLDPPVLDTANE